MIQPPNLPRGYPLDIQRIVRLHDGRRVFIRPILPRDAPELAEAISTADPDTIRRRFLSGRPHVTPELLTRLTNVDYVHRFALVAIDPAGLQGVAIARYESVGDGVAEVAVAVAPGWRDAGLGPNWSSCSPRPQLNGAFTPSPASTWRKTARSPR